MVATSVATRGITVGEYRQDGRRLLQVIAKLDDGRYCVEVNTPKGAVTRPVAPSTIRRWKLVGGPDA